MHIFFELRFIRSKSLNRFIVKLVLNEIGAIVFIALFRTRFLTPIPWLASSHHPPPPPSSTSLHSLLEFSDAHGFYAS